MSVVRRRLFWKVYLTLLASLVSVAVLMGALWWLMGEGPRERWVAMHVRVNDAIALERDGPGSAIAEATARLGAELGADISVYGADGALIAARGPPIALAATGEEPRGGPRRIVRVDLPDGRAVLVRRPMPEAGFFILAVVLVVAGGVGLAALPVTARLTRRLEKLRSGVERWGAGALAMRVDDSGDDEVAVVARTFNAAAAHVEALLASQKASLADASHELRSPLARLRMAIELWIDQPTAAIHAEIERNLAEVDQLVGEILLASRLDHPATAHERTESVDLLGLAAEEAVRVDASVEGTPVEVDGDATLLRRLIRNLLENAVKHGQAPIHIAVTGGDDAACLVVSDHGPGIAPAERERVFEPFYRPAGHGESSGGWGLGLSLVRQIAARHGGVVSCDADVAGGSRFVVRLSTRNRPDREPSRG
ncbi:MAG: integral rane sensor signal transduction histidine kinase [Rhodospirillales bacterium]|nr:integral rane sensor signal transduction histidine kinase [Rhodospirillales bacterium]